MLGIYRFKKSDRLACSNCLKCQGEFLKNLQKKNRSLLAGNFLDNSKICMAVEKAF